MGSLLDKIKKAVENDRVIVGWHADQRCEERGVSSWQVVAGLPNAVLVRERPRSKPNPSVIVRQMLADGSEAEVIWSWLSATGRAKLVTVFFQD